MHEKLLLLIKALKRILASLFFCFYLSPALAQESGLTLSKALSTEVDPLTFAVNVAHESSNADGAEPHLALTPSINPTKTVLEINYETIKLPGGEPMGWVGANLMFDVTDYARLGIGTYGAMAGQRGGFITLGVAGELRKALTPDWVVHTGLFVGAGGGRGGGTLAGGGLMLRTDLGLNYQLKDLGSVGIGLSHVEFPSGVVSSSQAYVQYEYAFNNLMSPGWAMPPIDEGGAGWAMSFHLSEFSLVGREYLIPSSVHRDNI